MRSFPNTHAVTTDQTHRIIIRRITTTITRTTTITPGQHYYIFYIYYYYLQQLLPGQQLLHQVTACCQCYLYIVQYEQCMQGLAVCFFA